jgi:hypothetical protein
VILHSINVNYCAISALAVYQRCLCGQETRIRARKGSGIAKISAIQVVVHADAGRRLSFEIDFVGSHGGGISALADYQRYLDGQETRLCTRIRSVVAEISTVQARTIGSKIASEISGSSSLVSQAYTSSKGLSR